MSTSTKRPLIYLEVTDNNKSIDTGYEIQRWPDAFRLYSYNPKTGEMEFTSEGTLFEMVKELDKSLWGDVQYVGVDDD